MCSQAGQACRSWYAQVVVAVVAVAASLRMFGTRLAKDARSGWPGAAGWCCWRREVLLEVPAGTRARNRAACRSWLLRMCVALALWA